ncbi:hypothetical protein [Aeromonas enteropelogenes]|uniref:hypothetical protein n=1 Tax=Aeromonas enteropelogenes TaxID=29489 RepID=UPI003BA18ADD
MVFVIVGIELFILFALVMGGGLEGDTLYLAYTVIAILLSPLWGGVLLVMLAELSYRWRMCCRARRRALAKRDRTS